MVTNVSIAMAAAKPMSRSPLHDARIVEASLAGDFVIPVGIGADVVLEVGVRDALLPLMSDHDRDPSRGASDSTGRN